MTLDPARLSSAIETLHQTLNQIPAPTVDEGSRAKLRELLADIGRVLEPGSAPAAAGGHQNRLEDLAVGFEAEHPALAANLRQIVDVLGKGGL